MDRFGSRLLSKRRQSIDVSETGYEMGRDTDGLSSDGAFRRFFPFNVLTVMTAMSDGYDDFSRYVMRYSTMGCSKIGFNPRTISVITIDEDVLLPITRAHARPQYNAAVWPTV